MSFNPLTALFSTPPLSDQLPPVTSLMILCVGSAMLVSSVVSIIFNTYSLASNLMLGGIGVSWIIGACTSIPGFLFFIPTLLVVGSFSVPASAFVV